MTGVGQNENSETSISLPTKKRRLGHWSNWTAWPPWYKSYALHRAPRQLDHQVQWENPVLVSNKNAVNLTLLAGSASTIPKATMLLPKLLPSEPWVFLAILGFESWGTSEAVVAQDDKYYGHDAGYRKSIVLDNSVFEESVGSTLKLSLLGLATLAYDWLIWTTHEGWMCHHFLDHTHL